MITFRNLKINSEELDTFRSIMTGNRRNSLSWLRYQMVLPEYPEEACVRLESEDERHANNESFTRSISNLWSVLKQWENEGVHHRLRIDLKDIYSRSDWKASDETKRWVEAETGKSDYELFKRRLEGSQPRLLHPSLLPNLSNVRSLRVKVDGYRKPVPATGPELTASLPMLEEAVWKFPEDVHVETTSQRRLNRTAFTEAMSRVQLQPRAYAIINMKNEPPFDERSECESLIPPGLKYDPFSASLRIFSQTLTCLTLKAHVEQTLFWPSRYEENALFPSWPSLRDLDVEFNMVAPSGAWYFTGQYEAHEDDDPAEEVIGDDTETYNYSNFRVNPDPKMMNPLVAAFANAVRRMPVIEHYALWCDIWEYKFRIAYYKPGDAADWGYEVPEEVDFDKHKDDDDAHLQCRRLYYEVGFEWRPRSDVAEALRSTGKEKYGGEVYERFLDRRYAVIPRADYE